MAIAATLNLLSSISSATWRLDAAVPALGLLAGLTGAWLSTIRPLEQGSFEETLLVAQVVM